MYHNHEEYECHDIYDMSDVLTTDEMEEIRIQKEENLFNSSTSMDSLGLSWRDFF